MLFQLASPRILNELGTDVRYALRMLRKSPSFTTVAVLSLALGLGANTAIFSLMEAALWKALPVAHPEQLRVLSWVSGPNPIVSSNWGGAYTTTPAGGHSGTTFSHPVFRDLQRGESPFDTLFAFKRLGRMTAVIDGSAELIVGALVSGNFYDGLGVTAGAGRPIQPADDTRNADEVAAVISDGFWARRFGRDRSIVGKTFQVNQVVVTVVGVNPPEFTGLVTGESPDVFLPLSTQPRVFPYQYSRSGDLLDNPELGWLFIAGRLKPDANEAQAQSALDVALVQSVRASLPDRADRDRLRLRLLPGDRGLDDLRETYGQSLLVLLAVVGIVLLIACVNVANLLLARAAGRQREVSLRLALGAGRGRVMRQMLTEGVILALLGGTTGLVMGYLVRNAIPDLLTPSWRPGSLRAEFDVRVLIVSAALTLATGVLFSLVPAWHAMRVEINSALSAKPDQRTKGRTGRMLVAVQVGLSVLLLVGASLFLRTLLNLKSTDLGFSAERIVLFDIDPPRTRYAAERRKALFTQLEQQFDRIPGVQAATLSSVALVSNNTSTTNVGPDGTAVVRNDASRAWVNEVGDRYFETMGIPILAGRPLGAQDRPGSPRVAVVNQVFARKFFPDSNPLGRTFKNGDDLYEIVAICGDARYNNVRTPPPPTFYRPFSQMRDVGAMTFAIKTASNNAGVTSAVRRIVQSIDSDLPAFDFRTQLEQIDSTMSRQRLFAVLTASVGILALVLTCIGIYGVVANGVARRTSEIGIRMALGAQSRRVLLMILRETAYLAGTGVTLGIVAAAGLTRYIESMLYQVTGLDPAVLCGAVGLMLVVSLVAGWFPARRAARLDPVVALRHE